MSTRFLAIFATALSLGLAGCGGSSGTSVTSNPLNPDVTDGIDTESGGNTDQPSTTGQPPRDSIENLFGRVSFTYGFTGSSNTITNSVVFTAADEGPRINGARYVEAAVGTTAVVGCSEAVGVDVVDFFCVATTDSSAELFIFKMRNQLSGNGDYEYCELSESAEDCVTDSIVSPDGKVDVNITRQPIAMAGTLLNNQPISSAELADYKQSEELQFGGVTTYAKATTPEMAELAAQIQSRLLAK